MSTKSNDIYFQKLSELIKNAYVPYSQFRVACLIWTEAGWFYGVNVENAAYPVGLCAERSAGASMVSSGCKNIKAVFILTDTKTNDGTPCGMCRQFLNEFAAPDVPVTVYNINGDKAVYTIKDLLPYGFDKTALESKN